MQTASPCRALGLWTLFDGRGEGAPGLAGSNFGAGSILSDGSNRSRAGGREKNLLEMWSQSGCPLLVPGPGKASQGGSGGEETPPAPSHGLWCNWDPQAAMSASIGVCIHSHVPFSEHVALGARGGWQPPGGLGLAPPQSRGSAQESVTVEHAPNILKIIKKVVIEAPSSWLPACRLTTAPGVAGGEACPAAKLCGGTAVHWGHGPPRLCPPLTPLSPPQPPELPAPFHLRQMG